MLYRPIYNQRKALIVGINKYQNVSPLEHATNDADAFAETLKEKFNFNPEDIVILTDDSATKDNITLTFHRFTQDNTEPDDKLVFFFAGHGHTVTGNRGEVGFLVPVDGTPHNTASLIRWDDFTRNAELIKAKHVLFIMDACYGGLAISRSLAVGSRRFLKDMCQRYARQVITAGKADERVDDAGGPLEGHSIFTGHLLVGLNGAASSEAGVITANGIMAYVYEKVGNDSHSHQTPHYGYIEGDGDFIFTEEALGSLETTPQQDDDLLIEIPSTVSSNLPLTTISTKVKEYISQPEKQIELHELAVKEIRIFLDKTSRVKTPMQISSLNDDVIIERIKYYENAIEDLTDFFCIISHWGSQNHLKLLAKTIKRLTDNNGIESGTTTLLNMRWYPTCVLLYIGGVSALANNRYDSLSTLLNTPVDCSLGSHETKNVIAPMMNAMNELIDCFKIFPGYERKFVPRSEYLFKLLQPKLDETLFLGQGYEPMFDRFEMFLSLVYADVAGDGEWCPMGRFGWKTGSRIGREPIYIDLQKEAERYKENWLPLKAGLFNSSYERFYQVWMSVYRLINEITWF